MSEIEYQQEADLSRVEFCDLLHRATLAERRPVDEPARIEKMLRSADVIITARDATRKLVGVSRAISDGAYCTYLSDLAVDQEFQRQGIGQELMRHTRQAAGAEATLILLAAPKAQSYYGHVGMELHPSCWTLKPEQELHKLETHKATEARPVSSLAARAAGENSSAEIADFFDSISDDYAAAIRRCVPRYDEMLWALFRYIPNSVRQLEQERALRVLELGSGTGNLTVAIHERFPSAKITAVDLSQSSLDIAAKRSVGQSIDFVQADLREVDFDSECFDLILSTIALHHLTSAEKQALFASCLRWLTPGGVLSYSDQFAGATEEIYSMHMEEWQKASRAAGASEQEWEMWMQHQAEHDFHDCLPDQLQWLQQSGFEQVDCVWRHLLWTVISARKPGL
ncbi:MAG: bifunctional GNAT family N-acetyltransferase/class I SAM-dependent methyltransferase [Planctomycetota bacterium]